MEKLKKPNIWEGYNPTFLDKINEIVDWINKTDEKIVYREESVV